MIFAMDGKNHTPSPDWKGAERSPAGEWRWEPEPWKAGGAKRWGLGWSRFMGVEVAACSRGVSFVPCHNFNLDI